MRAFLVLILCLPSCVSAGSSSVSDSKPDPYVYISGFSPELSRYRLNAATGELYESFTQPLAGQPSYLAIAPATRRLYAVNEQSSGIVQAFRLESFTTDHGLAKLLTSVSSEGSGPTHLTLAPGGRWVLAANYGDGMVASFPVLNDGSLGKAAAHLFAGKNSHEVVVDPSGKFVFVPCLGSDYVAQYRFDKATGALTPNTPAYVATAAKAGPRHLALHPNGRFAFLLQELNSTVTAYSLDPITGLLHPLQTLSSLPPTFTGQNSAAEIVVHPNGRFLYASNRGDDSLVIFAVEPDTGKLRWLARQPSGGKTPRSFTIAAGGTFLLVVNQGSDNVVVFRIDQTTGALTQVDKHATSKAPSFVGLAQFEDVPLLK